MSARDPGRRTAAAAGDALARPSLAPKAPTQAARVRTGAWWLALGLLLVAALLPRQAVVARPDARAIVIVDVSQSMTVADQLLDGKPVSRLAFARAALAEAIERLPCGSSLGLGVFAAYRPLLLFAPIEVCDNRAELLAAVRRLDTRQAWNGNSEIAKGYYAAWRLARDLPDRPVLVFISDGHEAPPVNPRLRPAFSGEIGELRAVLAGVGGDTPMPIPFRDAEGRIRGVWSAEQVLQVDPYSLPRAAGTDDLMVITGEARASDLRAGGTPGREHLSALRSDYLQLLATETGAHFARLVRPADLAASIRAAQGEGAGPTIPGWQALLAAAALALFVIGLVSGWVAPTRGRRLAPRLRLRFPPRPLPLRRRWPPAGAAPNGSAPSGPPDRKRPASARA